jgi:hypothetical protein
VPETQASEPDGPLSREQTQQVVEADRTHAKFLFAAKVASFNGWMMIVCAVLCVPFAFFSKWTALIVVGLALAGATELRSRGKLRRLDPDGAHTLMFNQLAVLLGVYVYCGLSLYLTLSGPTFTEELAQDPTVAAALKSTNDPALGSLLGGMNWLVQTVALAFYATVAALSTLVQGAMALFYRSRHRAMLAYLASTPGWIVELQRQRQK